MPACCITYTSDETYLFPTLVSAIQARRFSSREAADVFIFCVGISDQVRDTFLPICTREDIHLVSLGDEVVEGQTAMLARLFLNRFVPAGYSHYLYLDGDVQIGGSLDPLIEAEVPAGRFLAANDPFTFLLADKGSQSRDLSAHLSSIGLAPHQALKYFNSGVLRINRTGWDELGERAWQCYRENGGPSRFPDQDALNIVGAEQRMAMSLIWNFPAFMHNFLRQSEIEPRVIHFMSSPKPWHGAFPPWKEGSCRPYAHAIAKYPILQAFSVSMPFPRRASYHLQQHGKKVMEGIRWGWSERRKRVLTYEKSLAGASNASIG